MVKQSTKYFCKIINKNNKHCQESGCFKYGLYYFLFLLVFLNFYLK